MEADLVEDEAVALRLRAEVVRLVVHQRQDVDVVGLDLENDASFALLGLRAREDHEEK